MPDNSAELDILIQIREELSGLRNTQQAFQQLRDEAKKTKDETEGFFSKFAEDFKEGLGLGAGINVAQKSAELLRETLIESFNEAFRLANEIKNASENLNISPEAYQVFRAQIREAGGDVQQLGQAIAINNRSLFEAREAGSAAADAYRKLGLSSLQLEALPTEKRFEEIGRAILNSKDKTEAFDAAGKILGTRGLPTLLGALRELATNGYDEVAAAAKRAGQVMQDDTVSRLEAARNALEKLRNAATIATGEGVGTVSRVIESFRQNWLGTLIAVQAKLAFPGAINLGPQNTPSKPPEQIPQAELDRVAQKIQLEEQLKQKEVELAKAQFARQNVEGNPTETDIEKQKQIVDGLQREYDVRAKIIAILKQLPLRNGETKDQRDLEVAKLQADQSANRNQSLSTRDLTPSTAVQSNERFQKTISGDSPQSQSLGTGLITGAEDFVSNLGSAGEQASQALQSSLGTTISGITDGINGWINGTQSFGQAMQNLGNTVFKTMLQTIIQMGVQWLVTQLLIRTGLIVTDQIQSALITKKTAEVNSANAETLPGNTANAAAASVGSWGLAAIVGIAAFIAAMAIFGGFRESGGPVTAGQAYVVGEKRPEVFVPSTNGTIVPSLDAYRFSRQGYNGGGVASSYTPAAASSTSSSAPSRPVNVYPHFDMDEIKRRVRDADGENWVVDVINNNGHRISI